MTIFLDSNVFLYAAGRDHPARQGCQALLLAVSSGGIEAAISTEVVQEIVHVLVRRGEREAALRMGESLVQLFPDMLAITREVMARTLELLPAHPGLSIRDLLHLSTMQEHSIAEIATLDQGFDGISGIRRIDPVGWRPRLAGPPGR